MQRVPPLDAGATGECVRCDAVLRKSATGSIAFARVATLLAAILFVVALFSPLVAVRSVGRVSQSSLFSGPAALGHHGLAGLALVVVGLLVIVPAVKLSIELAVLFGVLFPRVPRALAWLFGWVEAISPWAMVEVFLLGFFVAYTRLRALATVEVGTALYALGGVMLCMVAVDATLDREALWRALAERLPASRERSAEARDAHVEAVGCEACRLVAHTAPGASCPRCGHTVKPRKAHGLARGGALLIAATTLYLPANVLPVMTVVRLARGSSVTILHGVQELAKDHLWPLAIIVLFASVVVPVVKLVSLATMMVMTKARSGAWLNARTRMFRLVRRIGRWSMIDIFMLGALVGVVKLGALATVLPEAGAAAFCAVVILTMAATEVFDPRLMWDAGAKRAPEAEEA